MREMVNPATGRHPTPAPAAGRAHRVVEILNCELGEALGHQVFFALGRHSLEPGGRGKGGAWAPQPTERPSLASALGWSRTPPSHRGRGGAHKPPELCPPPSGQGAHPAPLQLLAVVQQRLQVGEAEGSVEAVAVGPGLADVRVLFVEVLQGGSRPGHQRHQHQAGTTSRHTTGWHQTPRSSLPPWAADSGGGNHLVTTAQSPQSLGSLDLRTHWLHESPATGHWPRQAPAPAPRAWPAGLSAHENERANPPGPVQLCCDQTSKL